MVLGLKKVCKSSTKDLKLFFGKQKMFKLVLNRFLNLQLFVSNIAICVFQNLAVNTSPGKV